MSWLLLCLIEIDCIIILCSHSHASVWHNHNMQNYLKLFVVKCSCGHHKLVVSKFILKNVHNFHDRCFYHTVVYLIIRRCKGI